MQVRKYSPDQARDASGRWTAAPINGGDPGHEGAAKIARALAPGADADTRSGVAAQFRVAGAALHEKARELAAKVSHAIVGTQLHVPRPIAGTGGVEFGATHLLPNDRGHLESFLQVHPYSLGDPRTQAALGVLHGVLTANGVEPVPPKTPGVGVTFKRGAAPQR